MTTSDLEAALAPIMFDVEKVPLYYSNGQRSNKDGIRRTDTGQEIGVWSQKTPLLNHKEIILPVVRDAAARGWELVRSQSYFGYRRQSVRAEGNGSRVIVEMCRKDVATEVARGDMVGARMFFSTGYDGQSALRARVSAMVLKCTNGMWGLEEILPPISIRHAPGAEQKLDKLRDLEADFIQNYTDLVAGAWAPLHGTIPEYEVRKRAIESVSTRDYKKIAAAIDGRTAWDIYQGITYYLTHPRQYKRRDVNQSTVDKKSKLALDILLGREKKEEDDA